MTIKFMLTTKSISNYLMSFNRNAYILKALYDSKSLVILFLRILKIQSV